MEFEEMQKIWDSQNNKTLYVFDENALHRRIQSKKKKGHHITNVSELLLILVNLGSGGFVFGINFFSIKGNVFMYIMAAWMLSTAAYILVRRINRIKSESRFDRTMSGDLEHAISMATYQVRLSRLMRWNIIPIGLLVGFGAWEGGKSGLMIGMILAFFAFGYYASAWENNIYKGRKNELEALKKKLEDGELKA